MATTSLGKMVKSMVDRPKNEGKGESWTCQWDVVVSYTENEINQTLRNSWEKHHDEMITEIQTILEEEKKKNPNDSDSDPETIIEHRKFKYSIDAPRIRFIAGASPPTVELILPIISGTHQREKSEKHALPQNTFQICISGIPLGTVTGTYEEVKQKQEDDKRLDVKGGNKVCEFKKKDPDNGLEVSWVVMDFNLRQVKLLASAETVPGYDSKLNDKEKKQVLQKLEKYVQPSVTALFKGSNANQFDSFDTIRHALATVKNKTPPNQDRVNVDITPVKFCMSVCNLSFQKQPILSLFIHVAEGKDNGRTADLQQTWAGNWAHANTAPIPENYSASIMIDPNLILEKMIAQSMKKDSAHSWALKRTTADGGGLAVSVTCMEKEYNPERSWIPYGRTETGVTKIPNRYLEVAMAKAKDLTNSPALIHLYQQNVDKYPILHIKWEFTLDTFFQVLWVLTSRSNEKDMDIRRLHRVNSVSTFSIDHSFPMTTSATDKDVTFDIDIKNIKDKWSITDVFKSEDRGFWEKIGDFWTGQDRPAPPAVVEKRKEKLPQMTPTFEFKKMGLGFFLTTNLLNPGAKVISIDRNAGVRFPDCMLLVGHVVEGVDSVKTESHK